MIPCTFNALPPNYPGLSFNPTGKPTFLDLERLPLTAPMPMTSTGLVMPYGLQNACAGWDPVTAATMKALSFRMFDGRHARLVQEEPKPQHSYIGLIAMAILSSMEKKMVLCDIYQWILDHYPYFRTRGPGWRNSIRHNLSLNDCFIKAGRSANGKGHYWAIHPANVEDFKRGDFRRRRAQRKVRKHMGLTGGDEGDESDDSLCTTPTSADKTLAEPQNRPPELFREEEEDGSLKVVKKEEDALMKGQLIKLVGERCQSLEPRKKRLFDVESLLAPDVKGMQNSMLTADQQLAKQPHSSPEAVGLTEDALGNQMPESLHPMGARHSAADASSILFNHALSAWGLSHAGAPYAACWPTAGTMPSGSAVNWLHQAGMEAPGCNGLGAPGGLSDQQRRTPSPYSAAKWQETFAKIMARSYHWRNGSKVLPEQQQPTDSRHL